MDQPFLRDAPPEGSSSAPCAPGWATEPAGLWRGRTSEIVFDPRRHDVAFLRGADAAVAKGLSASGFERQGADAGNELWVRDRVRWARRAAGRTLAARSQPGLGIA